MTHVQEAKVIAFAEQVLGSSQVATITSGTIRKSGVNIEELLPLLMRYRELSVEKRGFEIKVSHAQAENPSDFGVLIRRIRASPPTS